MKTPKRFVLFHADAWLGLLLAAASGSGCLQSRSTSLPDIGPVGDFSFTERSGKTVTQADLLGKVWVASFVFTRCSGPCPQVSATMARLQSELTKEKDFCLITFTVDPARDDPKELTRYANLFQADPDRWLFLTGKEEAIHRLVSKGFKVGVQRNTRTDATPETAVDHDPRLVLIDRRGHIRGYFYGIRDSRDEDPEHEFEANLKRLRESIAILLREENR
jgi:protein SCO1